MKLNVQFCNKDGSQVTAVFLDVQEGSETRVRLPDFKPAAMWITVGDALKEVHTS